MPDRAIAYETNGKTSTNHTVDGRPLAELTSPELAALVIELVDQLRVIRVRAGSAGFERRTLMDKPPHERKPGAVAIDHGGVS